jgi:hypothetical protein
MIRKTRAGRIQVESERARFSITSPRKRGEVRQSIAVPNRLELITIQESPFPRDKREAFVREVMPKQADD